jgi:peptidoglycan-associated lipoprotein
MGRRIPAIRTCAAVALTVVTLGVAAGCASSGGTTAASFVAAPAATRVLPSIVPDPLPPLSKFITLADGSQVSTVSSDYLFDANSEVLRPEAATALKQIVPQIRDHDGSVEVVGYTDGVGTPEYNLELSKRRASAVQKVLVEDGIPESVLEVVGKGEDGAQNDVADSTRRRVEIVLK